MASHEKKRLWGHITDLYFRLTDENITISCALFNSTYDKSRKTYNFKKSTNLTFQRTSGSRGPLCDGRRRSQSGSGGAHARSVVVRLHCLTGQYRAGKRQYDLWAEAQKEPIYITAGWGMVKFRCRVVNIFIQFYYRRTVSWPLWNRTCQLSTNL